MFSLLQQFYNSYLSNDQADDEKQAELLNTDGNKLLKQKKYEEAIDKYTEAIDKYTQNAVYYANRAVAYIHLKNYPNAVADSRKASEIDPNYVKAYLREGTAEYNMGNYQNAYNAYLKGLNKTISIDENWESYFRNKLKSCQIKLDDSRNPNSSIAQQAEIQMFQDKMYSDISFLLTGLKFIVHHYVYNNTDDNKLEMQSFILNHSFDKNDEPKNLINLLSTRFNEKVQVFEYIEQYEPNYHKCIGKNILWYGGLYTLSDFKTFWKFHDSNKFGEYFHVFVDTKIHFKIKYYDNMLSYSSYGTDGYCLMNCLRDITNNKIILSSLVCNKYNKNVIVYGYSRDIKLNHKCMIADIINLIITYYDCPNINIYESLYKNNIMNNDIIYVSNNYSKKYIKYSDLKSVNNNDTFIFYIRTLTGKNIKISAKFNDKVIEWKQKLEITEGVQPYRIMLFNGDVVLEDERYVIDYDIRSGGFVYFNLRM